MEILFWWQRHFFVQPLDSSFSLLEMPALVSKTVLIEFPKHRTNIFKSNVNATLSDLITV